MNTAQQSNQMRLARYIHRHRLIVQEIENEKNHFHFPAELIDQECLTKSAIVELQKTIQRACQPVSQGVNA